MAKKIRFPAGADSPGPSGIGDSFEVRAGPLVRNGAERCTVGAMIPSLVLLAAGMSTRYGRLKQLEPVGPHGEALLDYAVHDAHRAGMRRVVLIIREELEEAFRDHVRGRWPVEMDVVYHHQRIDDMGGLGMAEKGDGRERGPGSRALAQLIEGRRKPWGTAHALLTARRRLPGPFAIVNADDFYGAGAYRQSVEFFQDPEPSPPPAPGATPPMFRERLAPSLERPVPEFGLITYTLGDTLSDHGGVSRGVCRVDESGWLGGVEEVLEIQRVPNGARDGAQEGGLQEDGLRGRTISGQEVELTGQEPISTNFWLFTPAVFPLLEEGFGRFLLAAREVAPDVQPEFLIPSVVNQAVAGGKARVRALPTHGKFLGITHPQDRPEVVEGLKEMAEQGSYPAPLWNQQPGAGP
jgi:hypothetical protein